LPLSRTFKRQIVEAEKKRQEEERLAVLAFAAEQRRKEAEEDAERARSAKEDQARRKKMTMGEIMAERKEEKEREKRCVRVDVRRKKVVGPANACAYLFTKSKARVQVARACMNLLVVMRVMIVCAHCS